MIKLVVLVAALVVVALAYNFPSYPATLKGWVVLVLIGAPLYLIGEAVFARLFSKEAGEKISKNPGVRVMVLLLIMIIFLALWIIVGSYVGFF